MKARSLAKDDFEGWLVLYHCYAEHYKVELTKQIIETTWGWLNDPAYPVEGIVADGEAGLVGLAHFRPMPSPLRGAEIGFLDDLVVLPGSRGSGAAEVLMAELEAIAAKREWKTIRWITRDDNYRARGFYDRIAEKTSWTVYEMTP